MDELSNDVPAEIKAWGRRWVTFLGSQFNLSQVWLAQAGENEDLEWIASWPDGINNPPAIEHKNTYNEPQVQITPNSHYVIPLVTEEYSIGTLVFMPTTDRDMDPKVLETILGLSALLSHELSEEQERHRFRQVEYAVIHLVQSSLDVGGILPHTLDLLSEIFHADVLLVFSRSVSANRLTLLNAHGLGASSLLDVQETAESNVSKDMVLIQRHSIRIDDLKKESQPVRPIHEIRNSGFQMYMAIPLVGHNETSGTLEIFWQQSKAIHDWQEKVLTRITRQIAFAMERSALLSDLRHASQGLVTGYNAIFEGLTRILGLRDHETEEHTLRVTQLTMRLVEYMKIPSEQWEAIRRGAMLHDIGKLGVPDAILLKPGSLTDSERRMMQLHVVYGYNILAPISNTKETLNIVLYHHERWDGSGYLSGLRGDQIPLVARLFAVVDVFDALTSDRPYRTAWSRAKATHYIKEQSGKQFDPKIVTAFLGVLGSEAGD